MRKKKKDLGRGGGSSVEMWRVHHENVTARGACHQLRLLPWCPSPLFAAVVVVVVQQQQTATSACTTVRETVSDPPAFRDTRRFARGRPSGSHDAAGRLRARRCRRSTSTSRGRGRRTDRGRAGRRWDDPGPKAATSGAAMPR